MAILGLFVIETFVANITAVLDGRGMIPLYLKCKKPNIFKYIVPDAKAGDCFLALTKQVFLNASR